MANFSSLIPKKPLHRAVTRADGTLTAAVVHLAVTWKPLSRGGFYVGDEVHGEAGQSSHSNGIRQQSSMSYAGGLSGPFHHLLRASRSNRPAFSRVQSMSYRFVADAHASARSAVNTQDKKAVADSSKKENAEAPREHHISENIPKKDKIKFLVNTLLDIKDSKEAVYGALDSWVAWERNFPIASVKRVIALLEKEQQWHRIIQVIKWMLSKGQGNTMGTYGQLIRALDMDGRAEEAHGIWQKKIGRDLHSVPWQLCRQMIAIYFRNNMLEELVKLFKDLESFDRKPPDRAVVQRVADAYEMLGMLPEKERVLTKYGDLLKGSASPGRSEKLLLRTRRNQGMENPPNQPQMMLQRQKELACKNTRVEKRELIILRSLEKNPLCMDQELSLPLQFVRY